MSTSLSHGQVVVVPSMGALPSTEPNQTEAVVSMTVSSESSSLGSSSDSTMTNHLLSPSAAAATKASIGKSKKKKPQVTVTMATAVRSQASGQGAQGENTGRWTAEEHRLFLQGLEQHGKGWKKIASLIKSRTVVQIRTHAQKYFQKLSKARQNGEDGEVSMEGRAGLPSVPPSPTGAHSSKRRRQAGGTKRKFEAVAPASQRPGKKVGPPSSDLTAPLPSVAPVLSPYVMPSSQAHQPNGGAIQPGASATSSSGALPGPTLDDSLFRFFSPNQGAPYEGQVNEVARQAGANPITVPLVNHTNATAGGEVSPTGVGDLTMYPSWTDAKDTPSWYTKGSDVDALLDVTDTLEWLADTGDIDESYHQPTAAPTVEQAPYIPDPASDKPIGGLSHAPSVNNMYTLRQETNVEVVVPPLPSLFDGASEGVDASHKLGEHQLSPENDTLIDDHLQVFENPLEEHDFVSSMLETTDDEPGLPILQ